jgi:hypothetical protein
MTCERCGARSRTGAEWCGQCLHPFGTAAPAVIPAVTPAVDPAVHRYVPVSAPPPTMTYSRWRKGPSSFGPVGRISWTVGVLAVAGLCIFSQDWFAIGGWCLIGAPLVLRSVWARVRIA